MNNNPYNSDDLFENDENNIKENEQHTYNSETDDDTVVYTPKRSVGSGNNSLAESRVDKVRNFKLQLDDSFYEDPLAESGDSVKKRESVYNEKTAESITSYSSAEKKEEAERAAEAEETTAKTLTKEEKKAIKSRRKAKARKTGCLFKMVWLVMVVLVGILFGQFLMVGVNDMLAINRKDSATVTVEIPKNATLDDISEILLKNGVINNAGFFKFYANITNNADYFLQGTYDIRKNMDYQAISVYLQTKINRMDVVKVQFAEGMNIVEIANKLEKNGVCDADEFLAVANSDLFDEDYPFIKAIKNADKRYYKLEGYLFPDTYDFYKGEDPETAIRRFLANYRNKMYETKSRVDGFDKKVNIEKQAKKAGISMEDLLTLASIIQAEAATEDDMYYISSVFHNRLDTLDNDGVSEYGEGGLCYLGSDATYFYPYRNKSEVPKKYRDTYVSKYDTYKIKGLPAGPVCSPGMSAIKAALYPYDTSYYYFCHKAASDGNTAEAFYAKTNDEHINNLYEAGLLD